MNYNVNLIINYYFLLMFHVKNVFITRITSVFFKWKYLITYITRIFFKVRNMLGSGSESVLIIIRITEIVLISNTKIRNIHYYWILVLGFFLNEKYDECLN